MSLVADRITWGIQLLEYANIYSLTLEFSVLHSTSPGARATMFCNAILRNLAGFMSARLLHRSVAVRNATSTTPHGTTPIPHLLAAPAPRSTPSSIILYIAPSRPALQFSGV